MHEASYLVIADIPNTIGYAGYMPLKSDFAFIFTRNEAEAYKTMAHELGHGAFYLKHPQDEYRILEGTDNLMDKYAVGKTLWKPQWDWIGDPSWRLYAFQEESDGASIDDIPAVFDPSLECNGLSIREWYSRNKSILLQDDLFNKLYNFVKADTKNNFVIRNMNAQELKDAFHDGLCDQGTHSNRYVALNQTCGKCSGFNRDVIYEEIFHAGQYSYYTLTRDNIDMEVEAKVAKFFSFYKTIPQADRKNAELVQSFLLNECRSDIIEIILLINSDDKNFNQPVLDYFDALLGSNDLDIKKYEDAFIKEIKKYAIYLQKKTYTNLSASSAQNYNGSLKFFYHLRNF